MRLRVTSRYYKRLKVRRVVFQKHTKSQLNQLGAMLFMISYDLLRIICFYPESNVDYSKKLRLGYNFLKLAGLTQNSGSRFFKRIQGFISEA